MIAFFKAQCNLLSSDMEFHSQTNNGKINRPRNNASEEHNKKTSSFKSLSAFQPGISVVWKILRYFTN